MSFLALLRFANLAKHSIERYHALMDKVIKHGKQEIRVFTTADGTVGIVDTSLSAALLDGLALKLERRIAARKRSVTPFIQAKPNTRKT